MILDKVTPGFAVPDNVNVIIEIPRHARPSSTRSTNRPARCSWTASWDPVDVLVVTPLPLISGSMVRSRPVGC